MNEELEEGYGEETDDWMMEDTRKEFISFRDSPGTVVVALTGKPTKQRSKFGKDQYWFPCIQLVGDQGNYSLDERILSTSSHQLRKKITKFYHTHPDNIFKGEVPFLIYWEGDGMNRWYNLTLVDDETEEIFMRLRTKI